VTALGCFAASAYDYEGVIARAIALGGDTDTVAAMAGAISGAFLGLAAVPARLAAMLEDGAKGRAYIEELAVRLAARPAAKPS
jgi:poly(ADP-ribose) glycohydrolase ARH3